MGVPGAAAEGSTSSASEAKTNTDPEYHLRRVERLGRRFLAMKFEGAQGLWQFQLDLLEAQRDIQASIRQAKKTLAGAQRRDTVTGLRWARWHARTLGDTLAWLVLGLDRSVIHSLVMNSRVGVHASRHGDRAAIAIAQHLANQGAGFPLLHDVTDCLRIGDITFVKPLSDAGPWQHRLSTVEVKTRVVSEQPTQDGKTEYGYEVQVTGIGKSPDDFDFLLASNSQEAGVELPPLPSAPRRQDPRHERQLRRMENALTRQEAPDGEVVELQDEAPLLNVRFESSAASYWPQLRRVIRNARTSGLATELAEPGLLLVAFYNKNGVSADPLKDLPLPHLFQEQMFPGEMRGENQAVIHAVPANDPGRINMFLPYYLYSIPKKAIFDIVRGRLVVAVIVNPAFIFRALEADGFEIRRQARHPHSAVVSAALTLDDGSTFRADLHNLNFYLNEIVHEFKGIMHLVETAKALRENMAAVIEHQRRATKAAQHAEEVDRVIGRVRSGPPEPGAPPSEDASKSA